MGRIARIGRGLILGAVIASGASACMLRLFSDRIGNAVLANAVNPLDEEYPPIAGGISPAAIDVDYFGGQGQGLDCSLPAGSESAFFSRGDQVAQISLRMRQACAFHDYCYRHGSATYNYTQADCDDKLQVYAFRLCRNIHTDAAIESCETDARKVTLGVRLGGAGSFQPAGAIRDDDPHFGSTYFEFDPYPTRTAIYTVARLADAPCDAACDLTRRTGAARPRALYYFVVKPGGMHVSIVAWDAQFKARRIGSYAIAGNPDYLTVAPEVVRAADGSDWFVWWQRESESDTGGRFAVLKASTATEADWAAVLSHPEHAAPCIVGDSVTFDCSADRNVYALTPRVRAARDERVVMLGIEREACRGSNGAPLGLWNVELDFEQSVSRWHCVPLRRIPLDDENSSEATSHQDNYRFFATSPTALTDGDHIDLLTFRRGASNGAGYREGLYVQRSRADTGNALPTLHAAIGEKAEPLLPLRADGGSVELLSIRVTEPDSTHAPLVAELYRAAPRAGGEAAIRYEHCFRSDDGVALDASWLRRPPAIVSRKDGARVAYLSRIDISAPKPSGPSIEVFPNVALGIAELQGGIHPSSFEAHIRINAYAIDDRNCAKVGKEVSKRLPAEGFFESDNDGIKMMRDAAPEVSSGNPAQRAAAVSKLRRGFGAFLADTRAAQWIVANVDDDPLDTPDAVIADEDGSSGTVLLRQLPFR